jgi:hypothetical protein
MINGNCGSSYGVPINLKKVSGIIGGHLSTSGAGHFYFHLRFRIMQLLVFSSITTLSK